MGASGGCSGDLPVGCFSRVCDGSRHRLFGRCVIAVALQSLVSGRCGLLDCGNCLVVQRARARGLFFARILTNGHRDGFGLFVHTKLMLSRCDPTNSFDDKRIARTGAASTGGRLLLVVPSLIVLLSVNAEQKSSASMLVRNRFLSILLRTACRRSQQNG